MPITVARQLDIGDMNRSHALLRRLDVIGDASVKHFAKNFYSSSTIPDFRIIEIETLNRCNNDCAFCPCNRNNDTRKPHLMDENLFYDIINQLKHLDYRGDVNLFSNNEPLLDNRIFKFVEYAKKNLPNAKKVLYTNGLLLNREKFIALANNLDKFLVDNYDDNFQVMPHLQEILDSDLPDFKCDIQIALRMKNQKLNTRGGKAPNRLNESKYRAYSACILPFTQMIVRPNGTIAKCCNDPLSDMVLGNLNSQTLREIWRGEKYQELRKAMYFGERTNISGCEYCDIFGLYNILPPFAKPMEHDRLAKEIAFRKKFGKVYIFDTHPMSKNIFTCLALREGAQIVDGFINARNEQNDTNLNYVTFDQAINEKAFILIPTPIYEDNLFELFNARGYKYERDYLIYPMDVW